MTWLDSGVGGPGIMVWGWNAKGLEYRAVECKFILTGIWLSGVMFPYQRISQSKLWQNSDFCNSEEA